MKYIKKLGYVIGDICVSNIHFTKYTVIDINYPTKQVLLKTLKEDEGFIFEYSVSFEEMGLWLVKTEQ